VSTTEDIVGILRAVYDEAVSQPIHPREPKLKKLIIIDEISSTKFHVKQVLPMLNACYSELREFGYGFIIICQYATEQRCVSPTIQKNAESFFIFRKKTINELERIKTLKHPNMDLIPYLGERMFLVHSEDSGSEPFFVKVPDMDRVLGRVIIRPGATPDQAGDNGTSAGDDTPEPEKASLKANASGTTAERISEPSPRRAGCSKCGHERTPRKRLEEIEECPRCKTRNWRG